MIENILLTWQAIDKELFFTFAILTILNVVVSTIKSLVTIKCGKWGAAAINAVAFYLNTIVTVYLMCDLPLLWKASTVAVCNFIGVFGVKWGEEKARKDKTWKIEMTVKTMYQEQFHDELNEHGIPHTYINIGKKSVFNIYAENQAISRQVKQYAKHYGAKTFAIEAQNF